MSDRSRGPIYGMFAFLFGTVIGGIVALMAATDDEGETREVVKTRVKLSKARVRGDYERIREFIAETAAEAARVYEEARDELDKKLKEMKVSLEEIDYDRYKRAVNEVVVDMKETGMATSKQAGKLKTYLLEDYTEVTQPESKKTKRGRPKKSTKKSAK